MLAGRRRVAIVSQDADRRRACATGVARARSNAPASTHELFIIGDGEDAKTLATVDDLCRGFARVGAAAQRRGRRVRRRRRRRHRGLRGVGVLPRHRRRAGADDAARDGRRGDRRQDRRQPARGQEPRRCVPPTARGARRPGRARDAARSRVPLRARRSRQVRAARRRPSSRQLLERRGELRCSRATRRCSREVDRACVAAKAAVVAADEFERTGRARVAEPRPHRRSRARDRGRLRARARRGGRGRARVRGAARGRARTDPAGATSTGPSGLVRVARAPGRRAARARAPTICSRSWRATRSRTAASRSCSRVRTGSSGSTTPTGPPSRKAFAAIGVERGRADGDHPVALGPEPEPAR